MTRCSGIEQKLATTIARADLRGLSSLLIHFRLLGIDLQLIAIEDLLHHCGLCSLNRARKRQGHQTKASAESHWLQGRDVSPNHHQSLINSTIMLPQSGTQNLAASAFNAPALI